jgi:hypothetical protein
MHKYLIAIAVVVAVAGAHPPGCRLHAQQATKDPQVTGAWTLTADTPHGEATFSMTLAQDGRKVTGSCVTPHGDTRPLDGEFADRTLKLATTDNGERFAFTAKLGDNDVLTGFVSTSVGDLKWVGRRQPKKDK